MELVQDIQVKVPIKVSQRMISNILLGYIASLIAFGFALDSWSNITAGMVKIVVSPGILISDYIAIAGIGAAFVNSGLVTLICLMIVKLQKVKITGPIVAALFTVAGFALFGKNILNIWPIFAGVWLYSRYRGEKFSTHIVAALFGTCLGPLVSQVALGFGLAQPLGLVLGILSGIVAGFVLPPLSGHLLKTHQGYNIYNLGFTAGVTGTMFMSLFRGYGMSNQPTFFWAEGLNRLFVPVLAIYFISMILIGFFLGEMGRKKTAPNLKCIMRASGALVNDFIEVAGFGPTLVNMGVMGLISMAYIVLVGGDLNGPTIGVILTVVGFGAFGKHPKNVIPIFIGVYLGTLVKVWDANAPGALLAAMCGTTLAPIAGSYGPIAGIVAGFLHLSVVMNVGYLHGGVNLYNNGFAGGLVAATLVPLIRSLKRENG
jgi:hypothetical protein